MKSQYRLGHQAPKGYRVNRFNSIEIEGDFAYCKSHNFIYNSKIEEEKLYNGLPCYYTDVRFKDSVHNYFKNTMLYWKRSKDISLKACVRRTLNCRNIPIGTIVNFNKSWYHPGKNIDLSYRFKIKKENRVYFDFEINDSSYFNNFTTCDFSKNLTDTLRANGFLVNVRNNSNFKLSMISTAIAYIGQKSDINDEEKGEIAIAYGYGKKIGYSSKNNNFMGYSNGCDNILFDYFGEFDKWSRCAEINKTNSIENIINILKESKEDEKN
jgi:hypothetical protein